MKQNRKIQPEKKAGEGAYTAKSALREIAAMAGLSKTSYEDESYFFSPENAEDLTEKVASSDLPEDTAVTLPVQPKRPLEPSRIAAEVIVEGIIRTEGALDCQGEIKGDLIVKGAITMSGKQVGNIQGLQVHFTNACIEGNVTAMEEIEIDHNTKIVGDIRGGSVMLDGHVTGRICAEGLVCLRKNAVLNGDVQAGFLAIEEGAQITGQIDMGLIATE